MIAWSYFNHIWGASVPAPSQQLPIARQVMAIVDYAHTPDALTQVLAIKPAALGSQEPNLYTLGTAPSFPLYFEILCMLR